MKHRFRVEGVERGRTHLERPPQERLFDETYEIDGEHPTEALEKLLHEVEWGMLDYSHPFTVVYLPDETNLTVLLLSEGSQQ